MASSVFQSSDTLSRRTARYQRSGLRHFPSAATSHLRSAVFPSSTEHYPRVVWGTPPDVNSTPEIQTIGLTRPSAYLLARLVDRLEIGGSASVSVPSLSDI